MLNPQNFISRFARTCMLEGKVSARHRLPNESNLEAVAATGRDFAAFHPVVETDSGAERRLLIEPIIGPRHRINRGPVAIQVQAKVDRRRSPLRLGNLYSVCMSGLHTLERMRTSS